MNTVLVVTDLEPGPAELLANRVRRLLNVLEDDPPEWPVVVGSDYNKVGDLLAMVEELSPDLIVTYRNLHTPATEFPYSLGVYVDVLTQATTVPVLLLPHPQDPASQAGAMRCTANVMAITDHLAGDHHLVSYGAYFTEPGGKLFLTHVEDEATLDRYQRALASIAGVDEELAREQISAALLKEPRQYIGSCRQVLEQAGLPLQIEEATLLGHHLTDYRHLVEQHGIQLLVLNTKDEDQLAMHGVAYSLSVELRHTPLLLL